ncbi:MAG: methyltransferase domain-containing protein [Stappiaceae bacterium]
MSDFQLNQFTAIDAAPDQSLYIAALEAFDTVPELQELKVQAMEIASIGSSGRILDVGCGFGLETLRLARSAVPDGHVAGIDKSAAFIEEANIRAKKAGLDIDFRPGVAEQLPFDDSSFDYVRAERIICYLEDPEAAVKEMARVARPGGHLAFIEPDFTSNNINLPDRALVKRTLDFEARSAVATNWMPGRLYSIVKRLKLNNIRSFTRLLVFPDDLAAGYFSMIGNNALKADEINETECATWQEGIEELRASGELFASIGYVLLTAELPET